MRFRRPHDLAPTAPRRGRRVWGIALGVSATALAVGVLSSAGPDVAPAAAASIQTITDLTPGEDNPTVPAVTPIRIRNDFDDLAVRPDGTMVVVTSANAQYGKKPARPAATAVRFGPLGTQLPSRTLLAASARAETTHAAVTPTGGAVAWVTSGKASAAMLSETSDDGATTAPQQLSTPGMSGWAADVASGGGAVAVLLLEAKPGSRRGPDTVRLAYRAAAATTFTTAVVPVGKHLRDFSYRLVLGASGDGAIVGWANEGTPSASLWRVGRDGAVSPELPIRMSGKGYVDTQLAVGGDGTIAATFGLGQDRAPDQVLLAQIPAGTSTLAPVIRTKASDGGSLSTQGVGLAVSPTGRVLAAFEDTGGSLVILEGTGASFTKTYVPYLQGGSTEAAWMPDGRAVVVTNAEDPRAYPTVNRLLSVSHAPGEAFGAPRPIGPDLATTANSFSLRSLVPAADGSAALAWEEYDGHRLRLSVARIRP